MAKSRTRPRVTLVEQHPEAARRFTARERANIRRLARQAARDMGPALADAHAALAKVPTHAWPTREALLEYVAQETQNDAVRWEQYRERQGARATAGVVTRQDEKARANAALGKTVDTIRRAHPRWSTRAVAREVLRRQRRVPTDSTINAMAARIRRLDAQK